MSVAPQASPTLPSLHLDDATDEPTQTLTLREWSVLHTVNCPLDLLIGRPGHTAGPQLAERLPVSIRRLEILCWDYFMEEGWCSIEEHVDHLVHLVGEGRCMVPVLQKLRCDIVEY